MVIQKTWTDLLGEPQGNESVDGNDIVREVGLHKFKILWSCCTNEEANLIYTYWTTVENNRMERKAELYYLDKDKLISMEIISHKDWHHVSVYNDKTDKSVAYETNTKDLKGLADFIYRHLGTN